MKHIVHNLKKLNTLLLLLALMGVSEMGWGQTPNGFLDFGTTANGTTATTGNTGFGGIRIGNGGGSFTLQNPGQSIGTAAEIRGIAPTGTSINSVGLTSSEYGTAANTFTVSFEVYFSGGSSGTWYFFAGNGASFGAAQSSGFTGSEVFTGIRWTYGASNTITTNNRNAGNWNTTGIAGTPFAQGTPYFITIVGNNSSSSVNYGASQSVASNTYDLWVNGVLVGDNLAKAQLANSTSINAFRFYGENSTGNVAAIALDNIRWYNTCVLPPTHIALVNVPTTGTVGTNLTSYTAEARSGSASGPVATAYTSAITVAKISGSGNISGTLAPNAVAGVSTYNNTQFDAADTYTISASAAAPIVNSSTSGNIVISSGDACSGSPTGGTTVASVTSATCSANSNLSLTGASSGTGITYQWQSSPDGSTNWADISGATSSTYTATGITSTSYYRCNVTCTNSSETTASAAASVTINNPSGGSAAASPTTLNCSGTSSLSLSGHTTSGVTYQWQSSTNGSSWADIDGATSASVTSQTISTTTYFQCKITCNTPGSTVVYSAPITVTVNAVTGGTTASTANTVCSGVNFTLSLTGNTTTGVTYQWQSSPDNGTYTNISSATSSSLVTTQTASTYYRCNVTCTASATTIPSTPLQVTMFSTPIYASLPVNESFETWSSVCSSNDAPGSSWTNTPVAGNNSWRRNDQGATASWDTPANGIYSPVFTNGSYSARFHTYWSPASSQGSLDLYVNCSAGSGNLQLTFDYINTSGTDVLAVLVSTDGGNNFTQNGSNLTTTSGWSVRTFNISSTSATTVIRLRATSDYGSTDIGIDNLTLINLIGTPTATDETAISSTGFTANWNTVPSAAGYRLDISTEAAFLNPTSTILVGWDFTTNLTANSGIAANNTKTVSTVSAGAATQSSGTARATGWDGGNGTDYWLAEFVTTGYYNLKVSSKQRSSSTGPRDFKLQYKIGASGTYDDVPGGTVTIADDYTTGVLSNLTLPSSCDNQASVYLRWIMTSNTSVGNNTVAGNGSSNIDDIFINGNAPLMADGYSDLDVSNVVAYPVSGLTPNTTYYYRVRAYNASATSGNSNTITVQTNAAAASSFTGTTSNAWEVSANWNNGVPGAITDVTIPANKSAVVNSNDLECENLTIAPLGSLTINSDKDLLVNEAFLIESDATGTGSFIENGTLAAASYTVERYLAKYNNIGDQMFHLISSPVAAQAIREEFVTNTPIAGHDFYSFDEVTNMWINTRAAGDIWNTAFEPNFAVGKGYLVAYPSDVTKNFTGVLNSAEVVLTCSNTAPPTGGNGWNLLGNPFPSAIDWVGLNRDGVDNALYYYDNAAQKYRYYLPIDGDEISLGSGSRYIPAMQGFMVHASTNGATLTISTAAKTHNGQNIYYKSTATVPGSLSLKVAANGHEDEAFIHFNNQATTTFDGAFDAYKLRSYSTSVPNLFTKSSDGNDLAINGLPELGETTVIPVYLEPAAAGTYSISANLSGLPNALVYLKDSKTNTTHNLSTNPVYSFTAAPGDGASRFSLHFASVGLGETPTTQPVLAYYHDGALYVNNTEAGAEIMLFGISGQLLKQQTATAGLNTLQAGKLSAGVYVVRVQSAAGTYSSKVIVTR